MSSPKRGRVPADQGSHLTLTPSELIVSIQWRCTWKAALKLAGGAGGVAVLATWARHIFGI